MTDTTLPTEITPDNALRNWMPPSTKDVQRLMVMVRVATRAMKLSDKLGDLSEHVTADEAAAIRNDLAVATDTLETLLLVCAAGYKVLDRALPSIIAIVALTTTLITSTAAFADSRSIMFVKGMAYGIAERCPKLQVNGDAVRHVNRLQGVRPGDLYDFFDGMIYTSGLLQRGEETCDSVCGIRPGTCDFVTQP